MMSVKLACAAWICHDLLFHPPTGILKNVMNFYNSFALFCLLIYLRVNKQTEKQFYDNILISL